MEEIRAELEALPEQDDVGELTREEFGTAVKRMKNGKATGKDGIAAEVWKHSKVAKEMLYMFLQLIWKKVPIPPELRLGLYHTSRWEFPPNKIPTPG